MDPVFIPYVQAFELECGCIVDDHFPITFGDVQTSKTAGECEAYTMWMTTYQEILISRRMWDGFVDARREMLIFHELGHCILRRVHDSSISEANGIPSSLMYPLIDVIPADYYLENRRQYLDDLFSRKSGLEASR